MNEPPLWVCPGDGETGIEFANRVFNELHDLGWYEPVGGGSVDDPAIPWHWTRAGTDALREFDRALGVESLEGAIRPSEAIRLLKGFATRREQMIAKLRSAGVVPFGRHVSDDALCFCVWETLNLMRGYGLRVEVSSILSSRRPKVT